MKKFLALDFEFEEKDHDEINLYNLIKHDPNLNEPKALVINMTLQDFVTIKVKEVTNEISTEYKKKIEEIKEVNNENNNQKLIIEKMESQMKNKKEDLKKSMYLFREIIKYFDENIVIPKTETNCILFNI
jgi:hypothetical protein